MKLSAIYQIFLDCQSVTTDSRNCPDGSLFIALKGESFNGNAFAGKALEDGCAFAIIDEAQYAIEGDRRYILVNDCLQKTLQDGACRQFLASSRLRLLCFAEHVLFWL